jgi:hypothetical protein
MDAVREAVEQELTTIGFLQAQIESAQQKELKQITAHASVLLSGRLTRPRGAASINSQTRSRFPRCTIILE